MTDGESGKKVAPHGTTLGLKAAISATSPQTVASIANFSVEPQVINSIMFECQGVLIQYCNDSLSFWLDGDTTHQENLHISCDLLRRIMKTGEEQQGD